MDVGWPLLQDFLVSRPSWWLVRWLDYLQDQADGTVLRVIVGRHLMSLLVYRYALFEECADDSLFSPFLHSHSYR